MLFKTLLFSVLLVFMGCHDDTAYSGSQILEPSEGINDAGSLDTSVEDVDKEDATSDTGVADVPERRDVAEEDAPTDVGTLDVSDVAVLEDVPDPHDISDASDTTPEEDAPTDDEDVSDVMDLEDAPDTPDTDDIGEPDVDPMLPEHCLGAGFPNPELPYDYFSTIIRIQRARPAGLVCGQRFVWSMHDRDDILLTPDLECIIETDCGPLQEDHPDYDARFLETCALSLPDFQNTTLEVRTMSIAKIHERSMVLCADTCDTPQDCSFGFDCVEGFCRTPGQPDPNAICQAAGLGQCRAFDPLTDAIDPPPEHLSMCSQPCDQGCGQGECQGDVCSLGSEDGVCQLDGDCSEGQTCRLPSRLDNVAPYCTGPETSQEPVRADWQGIDANTPLRVAIVLDDSGSLYGRGLDNTDQSIQIARATDPDMFRFAAMTDALELLQTRSYADRTGVALWTFAGAGRDDVVRITGSAQAPFVSPPTPHTPSSITGQGERARAPMCTMPSASPQKRSPRRPSRARESSSCSRMGPTTRSQASPESWPKPERGMKL